MRAIFCLVISLLSQTALAASSTDTVEFVVEQFDVSGPNPLSSRKTASLLSRYHGPSRMLEDLRAAALDLEQAIVDQGFTFYRVIIPAQRIGEGVVELKIVAFEVGEINVTGNEFHSDTNIRRSLPELKPGASPNTKKLQRSLAIANQNTSKTTQAFFSTEQGDDVDVRIVTRDRKVQHGLVWANDTGSDETGEYRVGVAYQNNNLFDRDHNLTLSFATSPQQAEDVQLYSVSYQVPFYRVASAVSVYAIRSDVDTGQVANFFDVSGRGDFIGGQFTYALPAVGRYQQFLILGLDDKLFDNDILFEGQPIGVDVRSRPVSIRHNGKWRYGKISGSTYAGISLNTGWGAHNDDSSYSQTRVGASPDWAVLRLGSRLHYRLGQWALSSRLDVQYTDDPLIPGEQFGIGGLNSLRGIDQRQLTSDRGYFLTGEIVAPAIGNLGVRPFAFVDTGRVNRVNSLEGELEDEGVTSIGAGLRWEWKQQLNLTIEYGYVVDGADSQNGSLVEDGDNRFHFQLLGRK